MRKGKKNERMIPRFSSEAEEAVWWDTHRPEIEAEIRNRIRKKRPLTLKSLLQGANASQPVTLRVSREDLEMARRLASRRGLGYQTYIKMLLRNALSEESAEGVVNDLCSYSEVQTGFDYWSNAESLSIETQRAIQKSHIVLVPSEGFGEYVGPLFPKGTDELFQFLRSNAPSEIRMELAAEDKDYKELALHADIVYVATVLARDVVAPAAVGLIVKYLKNRLGSRLRKTEVRASLILDQTEGPDSKTVRLTYEGPAIEFEETMREALSSINFATRTPDRISPRETNQPSENERK
jgi:predicted DNA binding CopG/RHH family protein